MPIERFSSRREALGPVLAARLQGAARYLRIAGYFRSSLIEVVGEALETVDKIRVVCNGDLDPFDVKVARAVRDREANNFTSALRESFKTVVFPVTKVLRRIEDFRMEFQGNDYRGEEQIVETLAKRGKFVPATEFDGRFDTLRRDAEELLFDADAVQAASLRRNAAIRPGWFWLPRDGLEKLIRAAALVMADTRATTPSMPLIRGSNSSKTRPLRKGQTRARSNSNRGHIALQRRLLLQSHAAQRMAPHAETGGDRSGTPRWPRGTRGRGERRVG